MFKQVFLLVSAGPPSPTEEIAPAAMMPSFTAPPAPVAPPPAPKPVVEKIAPSKAPPKFSPAPPPPAHIPPSFVQRMPDVRMVEGTNVKLECRVLGKPFPQVIFTKNGKPVLDGPR